MLDLKEERKYTRLRKMAQELHIPVPEAFWTLEVFDKDGKLLQRHHQRSHSWVRNAYNIIFCQLAAKNADDTTFGAGKLSCKTQDATVKFQDYPFGVAYRLFTHDGTGYACRAPAGEDTWGILVGSGTNAESFEDFTLQTKIVEGVGGGQLNHVTSEAHDVNYAGLVLSNTLSRYFNNNSGGNVSVNEVVLAAKGGAYGSEYPVPFITSRDKLASTVTVPDTGQLKVTYTVELTYPS